MFSMCIIYSCYMATVKPLYELRHVLCVNTGLRLLAYINIANFLLFQADEVMRYTETVIIVPSACPVITSTNTSCDTNVHPSPIVVIVACACLSDELIACLPVLCAGVCRSCSKVWLLCSPGQRAKISEPENASCFCWFFFFPLLSAYWLCFSFTKRHLLQADISCAGYDWFLEHLQTKWT